VTKEPRLILEAAGYEVVETDPIGFCCGAAGLYTILQPEASAQLGNQKADQVRSTGVTNVASANPGCEMQLRSFLDDDHVVAHPIEWYLSALAEEDLGET
jgi:glycolate oxidase iron-sulfur subunit